VVIDVGAGTGILSTIAMDYGASCVYAIEKSLISKTAEENFSQRKDKHRMAVHCCLAEDFSLGKSKADLIVSEWMGYFLIYENMLPSVLAVRDKCLKKDGEIIPREASLFIAGYEGEVKRNEQQSQDGIEKEYIEAFVGECMGIQIATRRECILKLFLPTV
jgi:protein arginine N-methyltransferase 1